jgi:succinate dehydrogenase / fumarate reductase flavoprotein subunit
MTVRAALERTESRGGHTRSDHPDSDPQQERRQVVVRPEGDRMAVRWETQPELPADLLKLIKEGA